MVSNYSKQHPRINSLSLAEFLLQNNVELPTIFEDQQLKLENPFTPEKVKWALQEASEKSASGPSGQRVSFLKLLFMEIPTLKGQ